VEPKFPIAHNNLAVAYLENEEYDKAEKAINNLEDIIGENDSAILTLRNSLAFERMDFEEDN
jgi:Flp pilus assembly protein TadD